MAIEVSVKKSLILTVEEGMSEDGKPVLKRYTYSNLKLNSTPDEVFQAAVALSDLYAGPASFSTVVNSDLFQ